MKYELTGRIVFEAQDTHDAFRLLAEHFATLAEGRESVLPLVGTAVKIRQLGVKTPIPPAGAEHTTFRGPKPPKVP
jgi:hypothetical protein